MIAGQLALTERLAGEVEQHAAYAIAHARLDHGNARLHRIAQSHAIIQSEVLRQVRAHLGEVFSLQRPELGVEIFVDENSSFGPHSQLLPHLEKLESAAFDLAYLRKLVESLQNPKNKFDHPSLKTILEIEARTCQARLGAGAGTGKGEVDQRLKRAKQLLANLGPKTSRHSVYTNSSFVSKLAGEVEEHRIKPVLLPPYLASLIKQVSSIAAQRTAGIKFAAYSLQNKLGKNSKRT